MRPRVAWLPVGFAAFVAVTSVALAEQTTPLDRLPRQVVDVEPPSARVAGAPGSMSIRSLPCRTAATTDTRRRIVELAVQEWAFFGFPIVDYAAEEDDDPPGPGGRGRRRLPPAEAERVAASIGGYWAVAPGGPWIIARQNEMWNESLDGSARWRFPWSAAFISWVMCESGLGTPEAFQRAIAHHTYIDQAIRARDGAAPRAAYVAYDAGEAAVAPGDMLCTSRRPVFRTLADRRRQAGQGARTHCDLVVKVDEAASRILAIGGNVRAVVGLKLLPAARVAGMLRPVAPSDVPNARPVFAHLRLRSAPAALDAFDRSPTVSAMACTPPKTSGARLPPAVSARCVN